jgi:hypothetical protein
MRRRTSSVVSLRVGVRRGLISVEAVLIVVTLEGCGDVAPTMSAVEELQKVGFSSALTLERLLQDKCSHTTLADKVLILAEAGMVSGRQMWELLRLAQQQSVRIIFCGDTKQIQCVEACDALRVLEEESQLKSIRLTKVERQKVNAYREAVQELRNDPERGFERLDTMDRLRHRAF